MKRFLSMLAMAVLVLQSVVTSAVYAVNEEGEGTVPEAAVETVASDPVSDEGNDNDVVTDLTNSEVTTTEVEETTTAVESEENTVELETPVFEEFDIEPLQLGLNLSPRLFAATEPEQSDFEKFVEEWDTAKSCDDVNDEAGCVYNPRQYGLEGVKPGSGLDEGQVGMWKLVQPTDNPGEYKISIAVKGQPKTEEVHRDICAVVVFDKSSSMGENCSCKKDCEEKCDVKVYNNTWKNYGTKWTNAVSGAINFSNSLLTNIPNAKIGLVTFSGSASIDVELDNNILNEVAFKPMGYGTNIYAGLDKASEMLESCSNQQRFIILLSDGKPSSPSNSTNCNSPSDCAIKYASILKNSGIKIYSIGYDTDSTADGILRDISSGEGYFYTGSTSSIAGAFSEVVGSVTNEAGTDAHVVDKLGDGIILGSGDNEYGFDTITPQGHVYTFTVRIDPTNEAPQATNAGVTLSYTGIDGNLETLEISNSASVNWVLPTCKKPNKVEGMLLSDVEKFTQSWDEDGKLTPETKDWEYRKLKDNEELGACQWTCNTAEGYEYDRENNTCKKTFTVTYDVETNGGTSGAATEKVEYNSQADLTKIGEKTDWKFIGWNTESTSHSGLDSYTVIGNVTLYAIFKKDGKENTVTYTGDDTVAEISTGNDSCKIAEVYNNENQEKSCNVENKPTIICASGYSNGELYDSEGNEVVNITLSADATTYTAKCSPNDDTKYTVEYYTQNLDGSYSLTGTEEETGTTNTEVSIKPDLNKYTGFIFSGENVNNKLTGKIEADGSLVLKVYYDRVESSIIINPNCEDENEVCDITTETGSYEKKVPLPEKIRNYILSYKVPEGASGVDSQTVTARVTRYCKGNSGDCDESEGFPVGYPVKIEAESVTYTAVWSNDMTVTVADGSNYQTDSTVYTFNTWKDGENDVATGSTLTLTSHKELVANYTESCNTGYHYEDTATAKMCVSDYKEVACKQEGAPANAHYNVTTGTGTWDGSDYVLNCSWDCDPGYRKDGNTCRKSGGGGGGSSSSSYSCKNLPLHAIENNKDKPTKDTDYTYSQNTGAVCTFQCISGYTRNADKKQCIKSGGGNGGGDEVIELGGQVSDKCSVEGSNYSEEEKAAYLYACENDITTIRDIENARLGDFLTRAEMAKMISVFATKELGMKPNTSKDCSNFANSIANYNQEMKDYMVMSCQLEIMGIHTTNYEAIPDFMPNKHVSRAEFGTVLSRILWGNKYEGTNDNYYVNHLNALKENNIITNIDPTITEYRAWVFLMLYRSVEAIKLAKATTAEETVEEQVNEELKSEIGSTVEVESGEVSTGAVAETETGSTVEAQTGDTTTTTGDIAKETEVATGDTVETGSTND